MAETAKRLANWEDIVNAPDDGQTYEVIGGELTASPRPLPRHGRAQASVVSELFSPFDRGRGGPGGWWLVVEPDVRLSPQAIVAPDVAGWRRERLSELPQSGPIDVRPDWVCEVLSPSNPRYDRIVKANLYLDSGIPFYWIVDVDGRTLEAFSNREKAWLRLGAWTDGDTPRVEPFDAIELDVGALFPPLASAG
jgi:Uma2 family endonuclease